MSPGFFLDLRHWAEGTTASRFPGLARTCARYGLDPERDLIPVRPAAHYFIGGVRTSSDGASSLPGLYACGEAACSGMHGANRIASNSLLEGLVLGQRCGRSAGAERELFRGEIAHTTRRTVPEGEADLRDLRKALVSTMWRMAGVLRTGPGLEEAIRAIGLWRRFSSRVHWQRRAGFELENLQVLGALVTAAAALREESRGTHGRTDFPERDDKRFKGEFRVALGGPRGIPVHGRRSWLVETGMRSRPRSEGERAVLVGVILPDAPETNEHPLDELALLADTAGAEVVGRVLQKRRRPDASTYFGKGKAQEVAELARTEGADLVIFDVDLSPAQLRNLEKILKVRVVDRTELILDIFALHARTHQARLQVELAQAEYLLPRLKRMWTHLNREGGTGQSSAIGTRGPGEKQIEIDRRLLRRRAQELKRELKEIEARRGRMAGSRSEWFTISLVGYTNAGKSTLLRRLTGATAYIADQLFATLDTKTRAWTLPGGKQVFLSDTVGFIRNLPHDLVASFYATLEEVRVADLILHVVDASHPDAGLHLDAVQKTLEEIKADETPRMLVLNKSDAVDDPLTLRLLSRGHEPAVAVSARTGDGIDKLADEVEKHILAGQVETEFSLPAGAGKLLAFLSERGTVLDRRYDNGRVRVKVRLGKADLARADRMARETIGSDD